MNRNRKVSLNNVFEIENYLTYGKVARRKMTDRQRLAKSCKVSVSHVTNMLHGVRTASTQFVERAREIALTNIEQGRV